MITNFSSSWPCLLYHDIDSVDRPSRKTDRAGLDTVVDDSEFNDHLDRLYRRGFQVASHAALANVPRNKRALVLTFDDGDESAHRLALPALQKYGFSATFYVVSSWIGQPGYLTEKQIVEMIEAGMEIGSHSMTHSFLSQLDDADVVYELQASRDVLKSITGTEVCSVAWPGGHHDERSIRIAQEVGYTSAMSCKVGVNNLTTDSFRLKRIEIRRHTSADAIEAAIGLRGIVLAAGVELVKNRIRQTVGLERYTRIRTRWYNLYPFRR